MSNNGKPKCLIPGCEDAASTRGLCPGHYQRAIQRVNTGKTTWEELEALGLSTAPKLASKVRFDAILQAAREKKGQQP